MLDRMRNIVQAMRQHNCQLYQAEKRVILAQVPQQALHEFYPPHNSGGGNFKKETSSVGSEGGNFKGTSSVGSEGGNFKGTSSVDVGSIKGISTTEGGKIKAMLQAARTRRKRISDALTAIAASLKQRFGRTSRNDLRVAPADAIHVARAFEQFAAQFQSRVGSSSLAESVPSHEWAQLARLSVHSAFVATQLAARSIEAARRESEGRLRALDAALRAALKRIYEGGSNDEKGVKELITHIIIT